MTHKQTLLQSPQIDAVRHSRYKHGHYGTPLYKKWLGIKRRCTNTNDTAYERYGGRGVSVCERWQEYMSFHEDMAGTFVEGMSLERIDNDGDYCPENCKWIELSDQAKNRRNVYSLEWEGQTYTAKDLAEKVGMKPETLTSRLRRGWSVEEAITKPLVTTYEEQNHTARS